MHSASTTSKRHRSRISNSSSPENATSSTTFRWWRTWLELVPVRNEEEKQVVLKAVNYYDEGMTPFDAFHAATAETRGMDVLSSEKDYEDIEVEQSPTRTDRRGITPDGGYSHS